MSEHKLEMVLTPAQSIILTDIDPSLRAPIDALLADHGIAAIETVGLDLTGGFLLYCEMFVTCCGYFVLGTCIPY